MGLHVGHLGAGLVGLHAGLGREAGVMGLDVGHLGGRFDTWEGGWDSGLDVGHLGGRLG